MSISDPTILRRRAGSTAILAFFGAMLASTLAQPTDSHSNADLLRAAAAHPTAMQVAAWCEILAGVLAPVAVLTLVAAVRRRGAVLAHVGAVLGIAGACGTTLIGAHTLFVVALAQRGGATGQAVLDRLDHLTPAIVVLFFALPIAFVVLAAAVVRAAVTPRWVLPAAIAFLVLDQLPLPGAEFLQIALGLITFGFIAYRINTAHNAAGHAPASAMTTPAETLG